MILLSNEHALWQFRVQKKKEEADPGKQCFTNNCITLFRVVTDHSATLKND